MTLRPLLAATAIALSCAAVSMPAAASDLLYTLKASKTLPSTDTGWDYVKMEPGSNRLFMARLKDGLTVFNVDTNSVITTVENSVGANGPLLLPEYNRGYIAMADGSMLTIDLKTLKPISRVQLDKDGGLNSAIYDPFTKRIHAIVGGRPEKSAWYTLDAATGKLLSTKVFPFRKMDDPATDGKGRLFAPARRDSIVLVLDAKTLEEKARWPVGCTVSKVRYQAHTNRVLGACGSVKPMFFALDADTGRMITTFPIGESLDGFAIDEKRHRIVTSNYDGTMSVIGQNGADGYKLLGTVSTHFGARMMTMDERTGNLFVVNATTTSTPPDAEGNSKDLHHPNSFVVLTYQPE